MTLGPEFWAIVVIGTVFIAVNILRSADRGPVKRGQVDEMIKYQCRRCDRVLFWWGVHEHSPEAPQESIDRALDSHICERITRTVKV